MLISIFFFFFLKKKKRNQGAGQNILCLLTIMFVLDSYAMHFKNKLFAFKIILQIIKTILF